MAQMEMKINGRDALEMGIRMGEGFFSAIEGPLPMKDYIENNSRLEHGKQVIYANPKFADREVILPFTVVGRDERDFQSKLKAFENILYNGLVEIYLPVTDKTYRLVYLRSQTYALNLNRTVCNVAVKFNEHQPNRRENS